MIVAMSTTAVPERRAGGACAIAKEVTSGPTDTASSAVKANAGLIFQKLLEKR
jgi:hypothetical protein